MTYHDERFRVLISGSRTWRDAGPIQAILRQYQAAGPTLVIHGAAQGADSLADYHARRLGLAVSHYPAKWAEHDDEWCPGDWCRDSGRGYCVAAGPRRNQQMIDEGVPHVHWAFTDKPLGKKKGCSKGTTDMVERTEAAYIPTYVVRRM